MIHITICGQLSKVHKQKHKKLSKRLKQTINYLYSLKIFRSILLFLLYFHSILNYFLNFPMLKIKYVFMIIKQEFYHWVPPTTQKVSFDGVQASYLNQFFSTRILKRISMRNLWKYYEMSSKPFSWIIKSVYQTLHSSYFQCQ